MKRYKVFIDPGHGEKDTGAAGYGVVEKNINLSVSIQLKNLLLEDERFEVKLSRESDAYININARAKLANDWNPDIVISKHHNSAAAKEARGAEVLCSVVGGDSLRLGKAILYEYEKIQTLRPTPIIQKWNSAKTADYYGIIRQTKAPAVITEFCFLSNKEDAAKVNTLTKTLEQAKADYGAILKYFNLEEMKKREVRYKTLKEVPAGEFHDTIKKLINKGIIKGYSGSGENTVVDLSADMVRMFVINNRAGVYNL